MDMMLLLAITILSQKEAKEVNRNLPSIRKKKKDNDLSSDSTYPVMKTDLFI